MKLSSRATEPEARLRASAPRYGEEDPGPIIAGGALHALFASMDPGSRDPGFAPAPLGRDDG
jgi:hypothetical protein